ncbi:PLP-dependent aminotransferase family protein [Catellatospora sp. KI3]|uniref:aminotransferase-like domain-containing protein n=1 Tax=Catellatospora sp. KI3 TaxID=3041620 RepID=UPI00248271F6|nr:PLP-dependent aminotransferase family protein [Catellatospora sp. KI3]MDI1460753.1 PLP-dependent aminotransferase family protein [Catellatospora sp. KI3]
MDDFRLVADAVEAEIRSGRLAAGDRLLPQREFARHRGMAVSTAARVYRELVSRGLVAGEVGRGTYVLPGGSRPPTGPATSGIVDLEANFPVLPGQAEMMAPTMARLLHSPSFAASLEPVPAAGTAEARSATARFLSRRDWTPAPDRVLFTGSGRQAIAAAIAALVPPGGRLGVEELTYPVVKAIAARLGVTLVPIRMDEHGLEPTDLRESHRRDPLGAVYLQPTLHNPLGITMPDRRRDQIRDLLGELDLIAIEDGVNAYLARQALPLAATAGHRTVYVDSLTKQIAPGLSLGVVVAPPGLDAELAASIRSGPWPATGFALAATSALMDDGTAARIVAAKQADASARQRIAAERLAGFDVSADPDSYHCWWRLPDRWRTDTFVAAAARHGISVSPGAAFAVDPQQVPNAIRIAVSAPDLPGLAAALDTLAGLARARPEDTGPAY